MSPTLCATAYCAPVLAPQVSNVETAIVFRTLVPVITSYADYAFMGREAPSRQSATGLTIVCCGALLFALSSTQGLRLDTWL